MIDLVKEREELIKKHLAGASGIEIVNGLRSNGRD